MFIHFFSPRHSFSCPLINLRQSLPHHLFFLHFLHSASASFFLSSFRSPAGPHACGTAVVDQTRSPAGGDIPFILSLFQMALLCISWQRVQAELFGGGTATEGIWFPLLSISLFFSGIPNSRHFLQSRFSIRKNRERYNVLSLTRITDIFCIFCKSHSTEKNSQTQDRYTQRIRGGPVSSSHYVPTLLLK